MRVYFDKYGLNNWLIKTFPTLRGYALAMLEGIGVIRSISNCQTQILSLGIEVSNYSELKDTTSLDCNYLEHKKIKYVKRDARLIDILFSPLFAIGISLIYIIVLLLNLALLPLALLFHIRIEI